MEEILENLKALSCEGKESPLWNMVMSCVQEKDEIQQLKSLKKVAQHLKKNPKMDTTPDEAALFIKTFTKMFKTVEPKSNLCRSITSIMQSYSNNLQESAIEIMRSSLEEELFYEKQLPGPTLRRRVEFISSHLENFPLGELVVKASVIHVLTFLQGGLSQTVQNIRNSPNLVQRTHWMDHCLAVLKTTMTVVQKSSGIIFEQIKDITFASVVKDIISEALEILNDESFSLECRSASGLTLSLLSKVMFGEEISLKQLVRDFLGIHQNDGDSSFDKSHLFEGYSSMAPLSHLFLLHGLLAMFSSPALLLVLTVGEKEKIILTDILFWELMKLSSAITNASQSLCVARSLVQWTTVAKRCVVLSDDLKTALCGTEKIPQALLDYIWQNWDHPVDGIRHQCPIMFQNLIETHVKCRPDNINEDLFLTELFHTLVTSSRQVRGKYRLLVSLVGYFQISNVLRMLPSIATDLMMAMNEQSMAPYASDLLEKLSCQHHHECQDEDWCTTWISPALKIQQDSRDLEQQNKYLTQYFVPKVLKFNPPCLSFVIKSLDTGNPSIMHSSKQLSVLITWLKVSRSAGILSKYSEKKAAQGDIPTQHLWRGVVSLGVLQQALCHRNSQVSLNALGVLCESKKTCEELTLNELTLLKKSLPLHMANQSAAFRQQLVALMKKLLFRLRESSISFEKQLAKAKQKNINMAEEDMLVAKLNSYKDFLNWLWITLMEGLSSGYNYPRRATSLLTLSVIKSLFKGEKYEIFYYDDQWDSKSCSLLLHRLTDMFDTNKVMAFELLRDFSQDTIGWQEQTALNQMYDCALQLSASNNPHHCESAAYLLRLLARQKNPSVNTSCPDEDNVHGILKDLCQVLKQQIVTGQQSLCEAAGTGPMYGILHCIRAILSDVCLQEVADHSDWVDVLQRVMSLCFEVASVTAPVVCNSSPEGYNPELDQDYVSSHQHEGLVLSSPSQTSLPLEIFHVTPQVMLVCCWRSMKEVSLTLGHLALTSPLEGEGQGPFILSIKQIEDMGNFFLKILQESKHRGAFEFAYAGFEKLCTKLWRCTNSSLSLLPRQWLHHLMSEVTERVGSLCATRRSAGVPFAIQAIVVSEPDSFGKNNFKETMTKLIKLVSCEANGDDMLKQQVHALNILRAMYRDTHLGEEVFQFVADGVKAAVTGFGSHLWAVRNSSTLLFSALVTRIFGVNREKDELSWKNCMTGRELFSRFPSLHPFLINQLKKSLESDYRDSSLLHPSLFPTLILLSHLHPSYQEDDTTLHSSRKLIPLVIRCCNCAVYKTRCMAARALRSLVSLSDLIPTLVSLTQSLPLTIEDGIEQNKVHGVLLMITSLLEGHVRKAAVATNTVQQFFSDIVPLLKSRLWIASSLNKCLTTRAAFLHLINQTVLDEVWIQSMSLSSEMQQSLSSFQVCAAKVVISELAHQLAYSQPDCVTLATEQAIAATKIITLLHNSSIEECDLDSNDEEKSQDKLLFRFGDGIGVFRTDILMNLLNSPFYEVRNVGLRYVKYSCKSSLSLVNERRGCDTPEPEGILKHTSISDPDLSKLVAMVTEGERNMECLEQILQALNHSYPVQDVVKIFEENYNSSSNEFFNLLLKLSSSCKAGADVCGPVIELSGSLLTLEENQTDTNSFSGMLTEWINLVEEMCNEDASSVFNLQVCRSLTNVLVIKELNKKFGNLFVRLWNVLIFLLLQNDDVILQVAVDIILNVSKVTPDKLKTEDEEPYFRDMHSDLAVKLAVQVFIELLLDDCPSLCLSSLCSWACGDISLIKKVSLVDYNEETSSNTLFEREETKYNLDFISLIDAALLGIVSIGEKNRFSLLSNHSSEERVRDLQQGHEVSNVKTAEIYQLRVTLSKKSLDILKTVSHELFQNMCSHLSTFLHAEPPYETNSKFLRTSQFEESWTHLSRHFACLTELSLFGLCHSSWPQHLHEELEVLKTRGHKIFGGHFA